MNPRLLPPVLGMAVLLAFIALFSPDRPPPVSKSEEVDVGSPRTNQTLVLPAPSEASSDSRVVAKAEAPPAPKPLAEPVTNETLAADGVINIGEYMDPDDPSTWPQDENQEVVNIGEYMDPDDPSTWPQDENQVVINIGEYMDPDDPATWSQNETAEVVNIGEYRDPDNPQQWPVEGDGEVINIGEYMDPDDPSSWPQK